MTLAETRQDAKTFDKLPKPPLPPPIVKTGMLQEVFNLDEVPVTLSVPATFQRRVTPIWRTNSNASFAARRDE